MEEGSDAGGADGSDAGGAEGDPYLKLAGVTSEFEIVGRGVEI